jgi:hypothetical protein
MMNDFIQLHSLKETDPQLPNYDNISKKIVMENDGQ